MAIVSEDDRRLHVDVTLEQPEEIMIAKAIDYFYQDTEATVYKMIWKTKHSYALIQVEKASMSTQKCFGGPSKRKLLHGQKEELLSEKCMISLLFDLWCAHVPVQLISAFKSWPEEKES